MERQNKKLKSQMEELKERLEKLSNHNSLQTSNEITKLQNELEKQKHEVSDLKHSNSKLKVKLIHLSHFICEIYNFLSFFRKALATKVRNCTIGRENVITMTKKLDL